MTEQPSAEALLSVYRAALAYRDAMIVGMEVGQALDMLLFAIEAAAPTNAAPQQAAPEREDFLPGDQCPSCYWHPGEEPDEWFAEEAKIRGYSAPAERPAPEGPQTAVVIGNTPENRAVGIERPRDLFVDGEFTAHSGGTLPYKIECDALTDGDIAVLAAEIARRFKFSRVVGVPRGGLRLAAALEPYRTHFDTSPVLFVDDVLTTGRSMEEARKPYGPNVIGVVIFARGPCPDWVTPLFSAVASEHQAAPYGYLSRLFRQVAPQCEPLPDLMGLCTQIDSAFVYVREQAADAERAALPARLQEPDVREAVKAAMRERDFARDGEYLPDDCYEAFADAALTKIAEMLTP